MTAFPRRCRAIQPPRSGLCGFTTRHPVRTTRSTVVSRTPADSSSTRTSSPSASTPVVPSTPTPSRPTLRRTPGPTSKRSTRCVATFCARRPSAGRWPFYSRFSGARKSFTCEMYPGKNSGRNLEGVSGIAGSESNPHLHASREAPVAQSGNLPERGWRPACFGGRRHPSVWVFRN